MKGQSLGLQQGGGGFSASLLATELQLSEDIEVSDAEVCSREVGHGNGSAARGATVAAGLLGREGGGPARRPRPQNFSSSIPLADAKARFALRGGESRLANSKFQNFGNLYYR